MSFIDGNKTYILGAITVLVGVAALVTNTTILGVDPATAFQTIWAGVALITGRSAISKLG